MGRGKEVIRAIAAQGLIPRNHNIEVGQQDRVADAGVLGMVGVRFIDGGLRGKLITDIAAIVGIFPQIKGGLIRVWHLCGDPVQCRIGAGFHGQERDRAGLCMTPHASPSCQRCVLWVRIVMRVQMNEGPVTKKSWGNRHSRDLRTWAGLADKGRHAKARPAISVVAMPPKIIVPAEVQIGL